MCGITGFVGSGDIRNLKEMNARLTHRGPDAAGHWRDPEKPVFLAHRRLSIIDVRDGAQPMVSASGRYVVSFNGEIYNHAELRKELEAAGRRFQSDHSDTEVLLHGYEAWGEDLPKRLNGMWAFALYDRERSSLYLSRDRFGKKPLFYSLQGDTFAFASELSALKPHPGIRASVSPKSLKKYFAYGYIPAPHALYENVYKLPGGCSLRLDVTAMRYRVSRYWDFVLEPFERIPANPEETWGEELRALIDASVRRRLMSDVPLGVFLSGGMDSSFVVACASRHQPQLKTFSIGFNEASFDESAYARQVAGLFKTDHHTETMSIEKCRETLPRLTANLDEPVGDNSLMPTYLLCGLARKHVTVALGGDGADELFAGYDPFLALRKAELYSRWVPRPVHRAIRMLMARLPTSHHNMSLDFKIKRTLRGISFPRRLWNPVWLGPLAPDELTDLFREPTDIEEVYEEAITAWESCTQKNPVDRTLQFYTKLYLHDDILVKTDRASMMHSLEVRAPYLDCDLVDFIRRIPSAYKLRGSQTKYLLKKAMAPVLPPNILQRSKKGFGVDLKKPSTQIVIYTFEQALFLGVDSIALSSLLAF